MCTTLVALNAVTLRDFLLLNPCRIKDLEIGGAPTSHTPAHNVPAVAAAFRL